MLVACGHPHDAGKGEQGAEQSIDEKRAGRDEECALQIPGAAMRDVAAWIGRLEIADIVHWCLRDIAEEAVPNLMANHPGKSEDRNDPTGNQEKHQLYTFRRGNEAAVLIRHSVRYALPLGFAHLKISKIAERIEMIRDEAAFEECHNQIDAIIDG